MSKMLRPHFLHHRELLGGLAHAAWETVLELMCAAAGSGAGVRSVLPWAGSQTPAKHRFLPHRRPIGACEPLLGPE